MRIPRPGAGGGDLIPKGHYDALVVDTSDKPAGNGNPMLTIQYEIEVGGKRRKTRAFYPLSHSKRVEELYDSFPNSLDDEGFLDSKLIIGEFAQIVIDHVEYNGALKDSVEETMKSDKTGESRSAEPVDDEDCPF